MLRLALFDILLFLLPFVAYGAYLVAARAGFSPAARLSAPVRRLSLIGAAIAVLGLVLLAIFAGENNQGRRYVPAQYRDGVLVPGHFE